MQAANVNYFFKMCGKEDKRYLEGEIISRERTTCVCRQRVAVLIQKIHIHIYILEMRSARSHSQSTLLRKNKRLEI